MDSPSKKKMNALETAEVKPAAVFGTKSVEIMRYPSRECVEDIIAEECPAALVLSLIHISEPTRPY